MIYISIHKSSIDTLIEMRYRYFAFLYIHVISHFFIILDYTKVKSHGCVGYSLLLLAIILETILTSYVMCSILSIQCHKFILLKC